MLFYYIVFRSTAGFGSSEEAQAGKNDKAHSLTATTVSGTNGQQACASSSKSSLLQSHTWSVSWAENRMWWHLAMRARGGWPESLWITVCRAKCLTGRHFEGQSWALAWLIAPCRMDCLWHWMTAGRNGSDWEDEKHWETGEGGKCSRSDEAVDGEKNREIKRAKGKKSEWLVWARRTNGRRKRVCGSLNQGGFWLGEADFKSRRRSYSNSEELRGTTVCCPPDTHPRRHPLSVSQRSRHTACSYWPTQTLGSPGRLRLGEGDSQNKPLERGNSNLKMQTGDNGGEGTELKITL